MTTPTPPAAEPDVAHTVGRIRAQDVLDNAGHYSIESVYLAKDVLALVAEQFEKDAENCELIEERDQALRDLDFQTKAAFANRAEADRLTAELTAARQEAQQAQAELEQVKALAPEATAVITAAMDFVTELLALVPDAATNEWCRPSTQRLVAAVSRFADTATTAAPVSPAAVPQTSSEQWVERNNGLPADRCTYYHGKHRCHQSWGHDVATHPHEPTPQAEAVPAAGGQDAADSEAGR